MKLILTAKKIARGLNAKYGSRLVINTSEFYGDNGNLVRVYVVKDAFYNSDGSHVNKELFKSASGVYTVLFMRDLNLLADGLELEPEENDPKWARVRESKGAFESFNYFIETYVMDIVEEDK